MSEASANLTLPYIMEAQAQKHVTHNEAIRALDALVQLSVVSQNLNTPPQNPIDGDRYIIGGAATLVWAGHDFKIAAFQDGAWAFYQPIEGWRAWVRDERILYAYDGGSWINAVDISFQNLPSLGINATADSTNRLSISGGQTLFNHEGTGHQVKVNKNGTSDTASFLFQTGFSGRAEIGLTGDDDFHFKISADGTTFKNAIIIDKDTGYIGLNGATAVFPLTCALPLSATLCTVHDTSPNRGVASSILHVGTPNDTSTFAGIGMFGIGDGDDINRVGNLFKVDQVGNTSMSGWVQPGSFQITTLPSAVSSGAGAIVYISDETGGPTLAFSDGTDWLRVYDRTVIS